MSQSDVFDLETRPEVATITLSRLLRYLDSKILSPSAEPVRDIFELSKTNANLEYARSLLLRLEHESTGIKVASRKQTVQADLLKKREAIKRLQARLQELRLEAENWQDEDDDEVEVEETIDVTNARSYAPAVESNAGIDTEPSAAEEAVANLTSTLRARSAQGTATGTEQDKTDTNNAAVATGTSLFPPRPTSPTTKPSDAAVADCESLLTAHRAEQSVLTDTLLSLARELKLSVHDFQAGIESGKDVLERAAIGLDKNIAGMDAAGKRMGVLRKMTEGRGWWGRLQLYGIIAVLWIAALFVVAFLPKLRWSPRF